MYLYLIYLVSIVLLYLYLGDKCFMNDLLHKNSTNEEFKKKFNIKAGTNDCVNSITHLKMKTIYKILCVLFIIAILSFINEKYSISNMLYNFVNKIETFPLIIHYLPLITLYTWIIYYLLLINY